MKPAIVVIVLAMLWVAMTGAFSGPNLLLGVAIASLAVVLLRSVLVPWPVLRRVRQATALLGLFLYELIASAIRVTLVVLSPDMARRLNPAVVAFPLTVRSDAEITLLANLITLTPGTLTVDVSQDRSLLYVHVLALETREALVADIAGGFEMRVRELFA